MTSEDWAVAGIASLCAVIFVGFIFLLATLAVCIVRDRVVSVKPLQVYLLSCFVGLVFGGVAEMPSFFVSGFLIGFGYVLVKS